jgi:hypothetical protein
MYPLSKIDDFSEVLNKDIGNNPDIALFKFCYVDITKKTDIQKVFNHYKNMLSIMKKTHPRTTYAHVTVPLTSKPNGINMWINIVKGIIKKIMGRPVFNYYDNLNRNKFNEMLRNEYEGKEPVFDLAQIESTTSDGKRVSYKKGSDAFYTLSPEYTYDSGHLNELGRKKAAEQFLIFLANISK